MVHLARLHEPWARPQLLPALQREGLACHVECVRPAEADAVRDQQRGAQDQGEHHQPRGRVAHHKLGGEQAVGLEEGVILGGKAL